MVSMVMDVSGLISYPFPFCGMVLIAQAGKTYQRAFKQDHASSRLTNLNAESMPELPQHHSPFIFCRGYRPRISDDGRKIGLPATRSSQLYIPRLEQNQSSIFQALPSAPTIAPVVS